MLDHLTLTVRDAARSKAFYIQALAPLGYRPVMDYGGYSGFGEGRKPSFWIKDGPAPQSPMHLAFVAKSRRAVDAFHAAALAAGARDDGPPGLRADYHPHYYGAFVIDLDGHPIEAVCHAAPIAAAAKPAAARKTAPRKATRKTSRKPTAKKSARKAKPAKRRKRR